MVKNQNKAKIMTKNTNKGYAIRLTPQLSDGLRYLSDKTKMTQIGILEKILNPVVQQGVSYESFTFDCYPSANTVQIVFYGNHGLHLISGSSGSGGFADEDRLMEFMAETASKTAAKKESKAKVNE